MKRYWAIRLRDHWFPRVANVDEGDFGPTSYAVTRLTAGGRGEESRELNR